MTSSSSSSSAAVALGDTSPSTGKKIVKKEGGENGGLSNDVKEMLMIDAPRNVVHLLPDPVWMDYIVLFLDLKSM